MSQGLITNQKLRLLVLAECRGSELYKLVDYIATLNNAMLIDVVDDFSPWLYEYAVFIYATHITKPLSHFIANKYNAIFDDQKTNFDHAMKTFMVYDCCADEYGCVSLVDLLVKMCRHDRQSLRAFLISDYYNNTYLCRSAIYLEFILRTKQNVGDYISNHKTNNFSVFSYKAFNLEDYIIFLRNFHNLIVYKNKQDTVGFRDYISYLGAKAITDYIEFVTQLEESGKLENDDIIISKNVVNELITSREFQMLKSGALLPSFTLCDEN